ncbi:N-acetylmuramoyl-L-alanine amidase [Bacillus cereus]|uniref:Autolysin n=1 Tax=Bacillus cereus TaxID=1396 RepID=A0AAW5KT94_BACCE|nr:N-acetylmuramoyl-L-alanine amidase [Bacillus cereus]MCQ6284863.1 N-acetylmuramoyl-L-alanine amidase [Bacillus cereus]MCQ6314408.1 N-acetylmuramoyl-L-alanine amidase [Bacillus cereus]MCQ6326834.1 N-acetylmuramoyl-L-alanine amidase [Bacillus cereus]MCQ6380966.1 N-acetylmuramoyl-L-alanine amidase [Bacillus cereus]
MKRLLGIVTTLCILFSLSTSVFADRILLIPDVPKTPYRGGIGAYEGVVAHSTATPEAPAINIQRYETRTWRNAFVHYAVDWNESIQIADTKYIAYGGGPAANKRFVHVELCETADYTKFKRSYEKYVKLLAKILQDNNLSVEKGLWTHNDVRKYLGGTDHEDPIDYLRSHGVSESQFRSDVQRVYNDGGIMETTGEGRPVFHTQGIAYILGNNVNLRKGPDTSYSVIRQLNKPEAYQVWEEKDGWLNLGGEQWVKYNPAYIRFEKQESVNPIVGKRVGSKVDNLRFYDTPSWQDSAVAGTVDSGEGFTIDEKVSVNGSPQFKVHNSKGRTYYMTASEAFVYVK